MNKNLLSPILIALLSTQVHAAEPVLPSDAPKETAPSTMSTTPTEAVQTPAAVTSPAIDCNYHIPASQTAIDASLITTWAENATLQSFTFTPSTIQSQLDMLKTCFTEQGWKGFNDALQKSGNVDSIKNQQLNVSGQTEGTSNISTVKDGQWKVTLPIQVTYQHDKEKVIQHLTVGVLVGRKPNGDLGIMQLVATAKPEDMGTANKATSAPATPAPAEQPSTGSMQTSPAASAPSAAPAQPIQPATSKPAP